LPQPRSIDFEPELDPAVESALAILERIKVQLEGENLRRGDL
jgi:hypothetical protein